MSFDGLGTGGRNRTLSSGTPCWPRVAASILGLRASQRVMTSSMRSCGRRNWSPSRAAMASTTRLFCTTPRRYSLKRTSCIISPSLPLRGQRAPSLTGARSPRLRRRRAPSLTGALPLVLVHPHIAPPEQVHGPPPELEPRIQGRPGCAAGALKKRGDDLLEKDILVQENRAFGYLPPAHGVAPQHIIPLPHTEVHLIVQPVAVDNKPTRHLHFVALHVDDPHVGHDVAHARHRLLAPVDASVELADPPGQGSLALVDPRELGIRVRVLPVPLTELYVAPYGHVVVDVVGDQLYPV